MLLTSHSSGQLRMQQWSLLLLQRTHRTIPSRPCGQTCPFGQIIGRQWRRWWRWPLFEIDARKRSYLWRCVASRRGGGRLADGGGIAKVFSMALIYFDPGGDYWLEAWHIYVITQCKWALVRLRFVVEGIKYDGLTPWLRIFSAVELNGWTVRVPGFVSKKKWSFKRIQRKAFPSKI